MGSNGVGIHQGWVPFGMGSIWDGIHWGWVPLRMGSMTWIGWGSISVGTPRNTEEQKSIAVPHTRGSHTLLSFLRPQIHHFFTQILH